MKRKSWTTWADAAVTCLIAVGVGVRQGLSYGSYFSNHEPYVTPGFRLSDPSVLARDWWTTQTYHPHPVFDYLVTLLADLGVLPWALAILNVLLIAATAVVVRCWIRLYLPRHDFVAWCIFLALFFGVAGTLSLGSSYVFSDSAQPSTLASAALVAGLYLFCRGRDLAAGLVLAAGGMFHVNLLILQIGLLSLAAVLDEWRSGSSLRVFGRSVAERLIRLVGPSIAVLAGFMPDLVAIAFDPGGAEVSRIFVEELFPFHYKPLADTASIQKLMAWLALGSAGVTAFWSQSRSGRAAGICLIALTVTSCLPVLASAWWPESSLTRLFPWRLTPFAVLVAQLLFASALVGGYVGLPNTRRVFWSTWRSLLSLVCLAVLAVSYTEKLDRVIIGSCMAAIAVTWLVQRFGPAAGWGQRIGAATRFFAPPVAAVLLAGTLGASIDPAHFNLIVDGRKRSVAQLYAWVRTTPADSLFLVPPGLSDFRVMTRRAIVVNLKANPVAPGEVLEWYRRLLEISGTGPPISARALTKGYRNMTRERLATLRERYGMDYAILLRPPDPGDAAAPIVFRNASFVVFDLKGSANPQSPR